MIYGFLSVTPKKQNIDYGEDPISSFPAFGSQKRLKVITHLPDPLFKSLDITTDLLHFV